MKNESNIPEEFEKTDQVTIITDWSKNLPIKQALVSVQPSYHDDLNWEPTVSGQQPVSR